MQGTIHAGRRIALACAVLIALAGALALSEPASGHAGSHDSDHAATTGPAKRAALHDGMRKLWEQHVAWTRLTIVSFAANNPDLPATEARLLRNQTDIGNAIKPYYGQAAGSELTRQLRAHILIAADVVLAAKAGDETKLADAQARWVKNADQIAAVLNSVNPRYWPLATMKAEMHMHLKLTTDEAVARLQGKWTTDVAAYDKVNRHILHMSDMLSDGIVKQFPSRFAN